MSKSRSFDRAASFYDQTRPLPASLEKEGMQAVLDIIEPGAQVLEVGAGTGRISIPLMERGLDLIGCDLSTRMLLRLREKSPSTRIAQADASHLPFSTETFDALLTAHVLHLVGSWREALREFQRVLKPGGVYLNLKTWATVGVSMREQVRIHWRRWLERHGVDAFLPGVQGNAELLQELKSLGASLREVEVLRYPLKYTLREELERFAARTCSDSWEIPDELFHASLEELRGWTAQEYGDLDQRREDVARFSIDVARFEG